MFKKSEDITFDIRRLYNETINNGDKSKLVLEESIKQHAEMCAENSEDVFDARILARELKDDIKDRIKRYSNCIINNTKNYRDWLYEDYVRKLRVKINDHFMD
jgi:tRNA(His) 5'-end guanylyltransferase